MIEFQKIKVNYDESWIDALKRLNTTGVRKTRNGNYEAYVSYKEKFLSLGTYEKREMAENAVFDFKASRLIEGIELYDLDIDESRVFEDKYLAFPEGLIFNFNGDRIIGAIDRCGYRHCLLNGRSINIHRIIATLFCYKPEGCDYVNHIDGDKQNNNANNLEWVTRSSNAKHAYATGLQTYNGKGTLYSEYELNFIKDHCFEHYKDVAEYLGRNPETVRKYMEKYRKEFGDD